MIPSDFIDELLSKVDIVDIIDEQVPLKKGGANYMACCPFHKEKTLLMMKTTPQGNRRRAYAPRAWPGVSIITGVVGVI